MHMEALRISKYFKVCRFLITSQSKCSYYFDIWLPLIGEHRPHMLFSLSHFPHSSNPSFSVVFPYSCVYLIVSYFNKQWDPV